MGSRWSPSPGLLILGYLGVLLGTVAALMIWPFSRPLIWLLYLVLGVFFLFAAPVIVLTYLFLFGLAWNRLRLRLGKMRKGRAWRLAAGKSAEPHDPGVWDHWLDGA